MPCLACPGHFPNYGVYQIGEVYARPCVVIGISTLAFVPKYFASQSVHRGVGISMTRA